LATKIIRSGKQYFPECQYSTPVKVSCCTIKASKEIEAKYNLTRKQKT
jgi:hypothetical protein